MPNVSSGLIDHPEVDFYVGRKVDDFYVYQKNVRCSFCRELTYFVNSDSGQCIKCTQNNCTCTKKNGPFKLDAGNFRFTHVIDHPTTHVFGCVRNSIKEATPPCSVHLIRTWCSKYMS